MKEQHPLIPFAVALMILTGASMWVLGSIEDVLRDILSIMERTL